MGIHHTQWCLSVMPILNGLGRDWIWRVLFLILISLFLSISTVSGEEGQMSENIDQDVVHLRTHYGEQAFFPDGGFVLKKGQRLSNLVWENPELVGKVLGDVTIPTRWFDASFREVTVATDVGRYYVYGEAPAPKGPVLRRAMTCYAVAEDVDLSVLAEKFVSSVGADDGQKSARVDSTVQAWQMTEEGVVEFAALMETDFDGRSVRVGQWQMENASRHVQLKRKLMGLDERPRVSVDARSIREDPAPVLQKGPLTEAEMTPVHLKALEETLDAWYAEAQEPTGIVVARKGVIVFEKGYGTLEDQPVTVDTPMLLHSAMKPLMGIQLAMYVDRGYVKLDEPMGKYLADFEGESDRGLTFRAGHVHATGIHFPWSLAFSRLFYFHTWHESLIAHCEREWAPGARHRYGVVGIILSVRALELMRGLNYWDAMERDVFEPLGIKNVLPGGTGFSAENLARIGVLLDNHGKYGDWELFSEETYQSILPTSLTSYFPDIDMTYGIGLRDYAGSLGAGSYGHAGGCGTQLIVNPEKHLVFAMVRNDRGENYKEHLADVMAVLNAWVGNAFDK